MDGGSDQVLPSGNLSARERKKVLEISPAVVLVVCFLFSFSGRGTLTDQKRRKLGKIYSSAIFFSTNF